MKQTKETDKDRINEVFIDWFEGKPNGTEFKMPDLITHVRNRTGLYIGLNDTKRRYLYQLRLKGLVGFICLNNSKSLYKSIK